MEYAGIEGFAFLFITAFTHGLVTVAVTWSICAPKRITSPKTKSGVGQPTGMAPTMKETGSPKLQGLDPSKNQLNDGQQKQEEAKNQPMTEAKPAEQGTKATTASVDRPIDFPKNSRELKIAEGQLVRSSTEYPTAADVLSDWDTPTHSNPMTLYGKRLGSTSRNSTDLNTTVVESTKHDPGLPPNALDSTEAFVRVDEVEKPKPVVQQPLPKPTAPKGLLPAAKPTRKQVSEKTVSSTESDDADDAQNAPNCPVKEVPKNFPKGPATATMVNPSKKVPRPMISMNMPGGTGANVTTAGNADFFKKLRASQAQKAPVTRAANPKLMPVPVVGKRIVTQDTETNENAQKQANFVGNLKPGMRMATTRNVPLKASAVS